MPLRSFLSRSRDQRSTSSGSSIRRPLSDRSINLNSPTHPRLRRVPAFSDLNKPVPTTARTVSVTVKKKAWREEAVAMTKCMSMMDDDKENQDPLAIQPSLDPLTHEPAFDTTNDAASDFSFVDEVFSSTPKRACIVLRRQRKSFDLRSQYSAKNSLDLGENSDNTMSSIETLAHKSESSCVCGQVPEASSEGTIGCCICEERFHLSCVDNGRRGVEYFKQNVFFCSGCERVAFLEITADDL